MLERYKRVPFLLDDNVGAIESVPSPVLSVQNQRNKNSRGNWMTTLVVIGNGFRALVWVNRNIAPPCWCRQSRLTAMPMSGEYLAKNVLVSCTFFVFQQRVGQALRVHETTTLLLVTLCQIFTDLKKCFTHRLSNEPFLICLLTAPPRLKYVATLPLPLSLMACFADINVSQGSV